MANVMLIIAAAIWGSNFLFQKVAGQYVEPFTFMAARSLIGAVTLLIIIAAISAWDRRANRRAAEMMGRSFAEEAKRTDNEIKTGSSPAGLKKLIAVSALCGGVTVSGSVMVQFGLMYTDVAKASFINALYIVFVPIIGLIFFRIKTKLKAWIGVGISAVGLYLLCAGGSVILAPSDVIIVAATLCFALHIQLISKFVHEVNGVHLACLEFFFAAAYCTIFALIFEEPSLHALAYCWVSLVFAGVLGVGVCYALQVTAQKKTDPTVAALLMSLESVFGAAAGVIFLHETMSLREAAGAALIAVAVVLAQVEIKPRKYIDKF